MSRDTTIYEEAGGAPGLSAAVGVLDARIAADPELAPYFRDVDFESLAEHQVAFLAVAFGGPDLYTGRSLEIAHAGLEITDAHFDRLTDHLVAVLGDLGLAAPALVVVRRRVEQLRAAIVA